jgi:hypothetical protein
LNKKLDWDGVLGGMGGISAFFDENYLGFLKFI